MSTPSTPATGVIGDIASPIVLYKGGRRLSNTATGWHVNPVPNDRAKKAGQAGEYTVGFEVGTFPWGIDVAKVIKNFIELTLDYDAPAVIAAVELEHAQ